ncbi:MAG: hypothetical protein AAGJ79_12160 [Verrucomicrobiota bacterium]
MTTEPRISDIEKKIVQLTVETNATQLALAEVAARCDIPPNEFADILSKYRMHEWKKIEDQNPGIAAICSEGSPLD